MRIWEKQGYRLTYWILWTSETERTLHLLPVNLLPRNDAVGPRSPAMNWNNSRSKKRCTRSREKGRKNNQGLNPSIQREICNTSPLRAELRLRNSPSREAAWRRGVLEGCGMQWGTQEWDLYRGGVSGATGGEQNLIRYCKLMAILAILRCTKTGF
jgi:hypothetical protein